MPRTSTTAHGAEEFRETIRDLADTAAATVVLTTDAVLIATAAAAAATSGPALPSAQEFSRSQIHV